MKSNLSNVVAFTILLSSAPALAAHETTPVIETVEPIDLRELVSRDYRLLSDGNEASRESPNGQSTDDALALASLSESAPFGREGTMRLNIHGAFGSDVKTSDNQFGLLGAGLSYFIIENLSLDAELNGLFIEQRGSDAWAGNFNLLFRWHFHSAETWSLYLDGGAGLFLATERVPSHGTAFNFTPQAGIGASFEVAPDLRMMVGVRWHHISNAGTSSNNPGRDSIMGYAGISLPF